MAYQQAAATITLTTDGRRVTWVIDYTARTFTAVVQGEKVGTWSNRQAGMQALNLIDVPATRRA